MQKRIIQKNDISIAVIYSDELVIADAQSALDLIASINYHDDCQRIAINKGAIIEDFFELSTGVAGEILQKFSNYLSKIAIIGDFSNYKSKPLNDFIFECNKGKTVFFVKDEQNAIDKLSSAV